MQWEEAVKLKRRRTFCADRPLKRLLQEYIVEHKDELEVETAQRHSRALKGPEHRMTSWPLSRAEWVRWLDKEQGADANVLRSVKVGVRLAANVRVTPHPDVPQKGTQRSA